jgi:hypothetical protein
VRRVIEIVILALIIVALIVGLWSAYQILMP